VLLELPKSGIIFLNIVGWPVIQLSLAWLFTQMPANWFNPDPPLSWEDDGNLYDRLFAIRRWKDLLPDGSRWFTGGFAKRMLSSKDPGYLARFIQETRRGELCHWLAMVCAPVFVLWNPWWADLIMFAYAIVGNLPCILVQRYNRHRLSRLLVIRISHRRSQSPITSSG